MMMTSTHVFLNLLRCEVKWKLFYGAKTMFKSRLRLLLISQGFMWFVSNFTVGVAFSRLSDNGEDAEV